jgi:hypothetical protein
LRIAYRNSEFYGKLGFERQFYQFLNGVYDDVRRKIDRNKERLALTQGVCLLLLGQKFLEKYKNEQKYFLKNSKSLVHNAIHNSE